MRPAKEAEKEHKQEINQTKETEGKGGETPKTTISVSFIFDLLLEGTMPSHRFVKRIHTNKCKIEACKRGRKIQNKSNKRNRKKIE